MNAKMAFKTVGDWSAANTLGLDNFELINKTSSLLATSQNTLTITKTPKMLQYRGTRCDWARDTATTTSSTPTITYHMMVASVEIRRRAAGKRKTSPNSPTVSSAAECILIVFQLANAAVVVMEMSCRVRIPTCCAGPVEKDNNKSTFAHAMPHFNATNERKCRSIGKNRNHDVPVQPSRSLHRSVSKLDELTYSATKDMTKMPTCLAAKPPLRDCHSCGPSSGRYWTSAHKGP
mmetsp:Transcript_176/g.646  ORF Transcript_176/g.646 Transcript_176/m.646 type:complete len:234 (-) Transcript_176:1116-1817(-)